MTDLDGKLALVTGASRGFGRAAALAFAEAGAHVCALARTVGALEELDDAVQAAGGSATLVPLDICDDQGLERLGAALFERWGRLDLWLHTATYAPPLAPVGHIVEKELDRSLATNIRALQRLVRVIEPLLALAPEPLAVLPVEAPAVRAHHGLAMAQKAAQIALWQAWGAEMAKSIRVVQLVAPPMPTAYRARFYPGEDKAGLSPPNVVARRMMAALPEIAASGERVL